MNLSTSRPNPASWHRQVRIAVAGALTATAAILSLTGCSGSSLKDSVCGGGEYPVLAVGGTSSDCVPDGKEVPDGYTRYPKGKVPQKIDDKWDVYWRTHTINDKGEVVEAPEGE
ncbi:SCO0607 family lipoprotein [Streptomyces sp. NPDC002403]